MAFAACAVSVLAAGGLIGGAALTHSTSWALGGAVATTVVGSLTLSAGFGQLLDRGSAEPPPGYRRFVTRWLVVLGCALLVSLVWVRPSFSTPPRDPTVAVRWLPRPDGTRLAVSAVRAVDPVGVPLIIVHGGPGVADMTHDVQAFAPLASDRDVYVYDRIGTGASSRLADPRGYTIARAVADLEALRLDIGAPRIALHGHSWGARIVVAYAQKHPDHVAALVLSAPGDLPLSGGPPTPGDLTTRLDTGQRTVLYLRATTPRNLFTYALTAADATVAHRLASDAEMDQRFRVIFAASRPAMFCDPGLVDRLGTDGLGYYAHYVPQLHTDPADDPVDLDRLAVVTAPVLLIKPDCDYLPWSTAGYRRALPRARLVMMPNAGHAAYLEQPALYGELVHDFLTGRDLPLPVLDGGTIPSDYRGTR